MAATTRAIPVIYKVIYDIRRRFSHLYGHVLFVDATDAQDADRIGLAAAQDAELDAEISRCVVTPSTETARLSFLNLMERNRVWLLNVSAGIPNRLSVSPDAAKGAEK